MPTPLATALLLAAALAPAATLATAAPLDALPQTRLDAALRCQLGVYALPKNQWLTINGADGQAQGLQATWSSGHFEPLQRRADGGFEGKDSRLHFAPCGLGRLSGFRGQQALQGRRLALVEQRTRFTSDGVTLEGKLVLPAGGRAQALAVWIEGSNNNPSTDDSVWPYELARRGVAVMVYDKRGTGASGGALSANFEVRARDTVAALQAARRLAPGVRKVGVIGGSQGGWVAPLVATLTPLDFVIPAFALAEGPVAQDQALVVQQVREAGFDETAVQQAQALSGITARIVRSNLVEGFAELDTFKAEHAGAPWLTAIEPRSYTGLLLKFSSEDIKTHGPAMAQGLPFAYEPQPVIASIAARQLWLLGGQDRQAPNAGTQAFLRSLQARRPDVAVLVFPNADHGLLEPVQSADGPALTYAPRVFEVTADWIKTNRLPARGVFIQMPAGR